MRSWPALQDLGLGFSPFASPLRHREVASEVPKHVFLRGEHVIQNMFESLLFMFCVFRMLCMRCMFSIVVQQIQKNTKLKTPS